MRFTRSFVGLLLALVVAGPAFAADPAPNTDERLRALEERLRAQEEEIRRLKEELARQGEALPEIQQEIDRLVGKVEDEGYWQQPGTMRAYYKDGLFFETADKAFQVRIGGIMNIDAAGFDADQELEDEFEEFESGTEFRRARLFARGKVYSRVIFMAEYDFAGGDVKYKDIWMGLTELPVVGTVKVGHFREPMSLEQLSSTGLLQFLELSLLDTLVPKRNVGIAAEDRAFDDRLVWSYGYFSDTDDSGEGPISTGLTGRVAGMPWVDKESGTALIVGASLSHREPDTRQFRFSSRPEANLAPVVADTGNFDARRANLIGLETSFVAGPFFAQAEYVAFLADGARGGDQRFDACYAYAGVVLLGGNHNLAKCLADRPKILQNAFDGGGPGLVEIGLRYSHLDLTDGAIDGGDVDDVTVGVNWWLNPLTRIMLNWVHSRVRDYGEMDAILIRFQFDF